MTTSKLFLWYGSDFADDDANLVRALAGYASGTAVGDALAAVSEPTLVFRDYDWGANDV